MFHWKSWNLLLPHFIQIVCFLTSFCFNYSHTVGWPRYRMSWIDLWSLSFSHPWLTNPPLFPAHSWNLFVISFHFSSFSIYTPAHCRQTLLPLVCYSTYPPSPCSFLYLDCPENGGCKFPSDDDIPEKWNLQSFWLTWTVAYPGIFFRGGGFNKFSWGQREWGSRGGSPLVRGSGGSCNLVQEISFHTVKFSQFLVLLDYLWWQPIYLSLLM